jgi:antitoxin ChpS
MQTTILRKVGGSVMMTVPPAMLEQLNLAAGATVGIDVEDGRLIVHSRKPKYTVEELLAGYDPELHRTEEDREWLESPPVGRELI